MIGKSGVAFDCSIDRRYRCFCYLSHFIVVSFLLIRGFYPRGGGQVTLIPKPVKVISPIVVALRGDINSIEIEAFTAGVLAKRVSFFFIVIAS